MHWVKLRWDRSVFCKIANRVGMLLSIAAVIFLTSTTSFAQGPASGGNSALIDGPSSASQPSQKQNPSKSDEPSAANDTDHTAKTDANRLSVNPVTGMITSSSSSYKPLTGQERWKAYWKMNFLSVGAYLGPVLTAAIYDQSTDSPRQWGPGISGYGLRVASRTANAMLQGTIQAPVAALLHEDVRYITSSQHGFGRRTLHAIKYSFLTYNEHGRPTLNVANLSAYYGSTAITNFWLPGHQSVGETFESSTQQIALSLPINILQEFWPDISHGLWHRHAN